MNVLKAHTVVVQMRRVATQVARTSVLVKLDIKAMEPLVQVSTLKLVSTNIYY